MLGPWGTSFMRDVKKADRSLFLWTVNDEKNMKWCVSKGVDGVITDDPKKYLDLSSRWKGGWAFPSLYNLGFCIMIWIMTPYFKRIFVKKFGIKMDKRSVCKDLGIEDDSKL